MGNATMTIDGNKIAHSLRELDESKVQEFLEIVKRACGEKPSKADLRELKKWLDVYPELWKSVFDLAHIIEESFIESIAGGKILVLAMQKNTDEIRNEMGYGKAPIMEQMLIDNLVISWLEVQYCNYQLMVRMGRDEKIVLLEFWERRLSMSQRRYLSACEKLAKVRRLMSGKPTVQVNIAAQGGQQVNVAGDVVKN